MKKDTHKKKKKKHKQKKNNNNKKNTKKQKKKTTTKKLPLQTNLFLYLICFLFQKDPSFQNEDITRKNICLGKTKPDENKHK